MLDVRFFANARFSAASVNVTLVFFALFGFIFMATQYLQFVLGYSAFDAGVRTLPFAGALMVMAPLSSKAVQWFGTKRVVVSGMLLFAAGLVVASTSTVTSGYPRVMIAMILMGSGMGLSVAPATESIMGSLPLHQAGVGSAVNDTSREVGGALGVAIIGSMLSSLYATDLNRKLPANVPTQVRDAADQSVGAALQVSARLGRLGAPLADAARESFVYAMARASLVTAVVAVVGALLAWRFLPARATEVETREVDVDAVDECELAEVG
jgi:predicted MFS family arabinose efflux permease